MKILVTGAAGFVGRHLTRELGAAGHTVCMVDRNRTSSPEATSSGEYVLDLCDREKTRAMLDAEQPEAIIHLAGYAHVGRSWAEPAAAMRANVEATVGLYADACRVLRHTARFLYISSAEIYGWVEPESLPIDLDTPSQPISPYGLSKYTAELALYMQRSRGNVEILIARPFNHIGPGQRSDFACPSFALKIAEMEMGKLDVLTHGNLSARRDFLDVRDVVRAYRLIIEHGIDGESFIVASGVSVSMEEIVRKLFSLSLIEPAMRPDPSLFRDVDIPELLGDPSFLCERTGWEPQISLDQTLGEVLVEARKNARRENP